MLKHNINEFNVFFKDLRTNWALLTCGGKDDANSMTISWGGIGVLWNKEVAFVFVRKSRYTLELMDKYDNFTLSFFDGAMKKPLGEVMGRLSGKENNKYLLSGMTKIYDVDNNTCYVKEAKRVLKLRKLFKMEMSEAAFLDSDLLNTWYSDHDTHFLFVGEIKSYLVNSDEE